MNMIMRVASSTNCFTNVMRNQQSHNYLTSIDTPKSSFLDLKIEIAHRILRSCHFCERMCEVNREQTTGTCRLGADAYVSSWFHHMGEEAPLIPSGTKN